MKLRSLLSVAAIVATFNASAQTWVKDSVTMGAGYANDSYYSLRNGEQKNTPNANWHLAFQATPQGPYGNVSVLANHVAGAVKVFPLHVSGSASFASLAAADTVGKTITQVYNADSSWNYGAFNRVVSSNPLNFSWGFYDMITHNVNGDSVYLLKVGTTAPVDYKLWIQTYVSYPNDSVKWVFRIAKFDGSDDHVVTIRPHDYTDRMFVYYNATTGTVLDRELSRFSWDILFTRYVSIQTQGSSTQPYNVTGVLSNFNTTVADVRGVNADTAHYINYPFSKNMSEIGSDWKTFNMAVTPPRYDVDTTATFFVKTATSEYWQLQFTAFDYTIGKSVFRKRLVNTATSVSTVNNTVANYYVAPVPANNSVSMMVDTKEATSGAVVMLTDIAGRTIYNQPVTVQKGMNTFSINTASFPSGMYVLSLNGQNIKLVQKITVAH